LSQGILFYSNNDWANLRRWANSDQYSVEFLEQVYEAIGAQLHSGAAGEENAEPGARGAAGPVDARRLQQVVTKESKRVDETMVRVAISLLERADLLGRGFDVAQELSILAAKPLPEAARTHKGLQRLLKGLALQPGQAAAFATADIARFMRWELYDVESHLLKWQAEGWLTARGEKRRMYVELPPRPADAAERLERLLSHAAIVADRRIDDMVGYATGEGCRHGYISAHFGSPPRTRCAVCDNCTGVRPDIQAPEPVLHFLPESGDIEPMILDCLLSLPRPVGRSGLAHILAGTLKARFGAHEARHHGALKGLGEGQIGEFIDRLLKGERLRQYTSGQGFLMLALTGLGRKEAEAWLREHPEFGALQPAPVAEGEAAAEPEAAEGDKYTDLQKALWLWRRRMAEELGQPVYVIMSNELMLRVAELRPQTLDELGSLPGIGAQRLQHYGAAILDIVKLHPARGGDEALLAVQRQALAETTEGNKAAAGKLRQAAAAHSPQLERKILMRLQEMRQKRAVAERAKPYSIAPDSLLRSGQRGGTHRHPRLPQQRTDEPGRADRSRHREPERISLKLRRRAPDLPPCARPCSRAAWGISRRCSRSARWWRGRR
jgi:ATP-dependent DNA helicase RecQ